MGLSALDRYRFDVHGYLLFEDVLDSGQVATLQRAVAVQGLPAPGETVAEQRFGFWGELLRWDPLFRDLIDHPLVLDVLEALIGPHARLDHAYGIMMRPGTAGLGLHGPQPPFDASQFYVHRGGRMWNGLLSFSWALTRAQPGEGGFGCIPGSHRAEEPLPEGADALAVEVPQGAGSLVVFTEALAHCTMPWAGPEDRLSALQVFAGELDVGPAPGRPGRRADSPQPPPAAPGRTPVRGRPSAFAAVVSVHAPHVDAR